MAVTWWRPLTVCIAPKHRARLTDALLQMIRFDESHSAPAVRGAQDRRVITGEKVSLDSGLQVARRRQTGRGDSRLLRILPIIVDRDPASICIEQRELWISQGVLDTRVYQRWSKRAKNYPRYVGARDNGPADHYVLVRCNEAASAEIRELR